MNDRQLQWHHDALLMLHETGHRPTITYLHDPHCPCAHGNPAALPACQCRPIIEVDGAPMIVNDTGDLVMLRRQ